MNHPTCPVCGSDSVHRSRRRNWLDRAIRLAGARVCRCHQCNARFASLGGSLIRVADVSSAARRLVLFLTMVTATAVIMVAIVWLSRISSNLDQPGELVR